MKKGIMAGLLLAAAFTLVSCDEESAKKEIGASAKKEAEVSVKKDKFTDPRDGKTYSYVKIGEQTWMAENLNFAAPGSKCYGEGARVQVGMNTYKTLSDKEVQDNCTKYGRLYNWATAMAVDESYNQTNYKVQSKHQGICPKGWHLPDEKEWETLVGSNGIAVSKLKTKSGWEEYIHDITRKTMSGNGTDDYGFSALPGGKYVPHNYDAGRNTFTSLESQGNWWTSVCKYKEAYELIITSALIFYPSSANKTDFYSVRCLKDTPNSTPASETASAPASETAPAPAVATATDYSSALQTNFPNGSLGENKRPIEVFFQNVSKSGNSYTVNGYTKTKAAQDTFSGTLTVSSETKGGSCGAGTELKGSYNFNEKESKTSGRFEGNFVACENSGNLSSGNFNGKWIKHSNNSAIPCSWRK